MVDADLKPRILRLMHEHCLEKKEGTGEAAQSVLLTLKREGLITTFMDQYGVEVIGQFWLSHREEQFEPIHSGPIKMYERHEPGVSRSDVTVANRAIQRLLDEQESVNGTWMRVRQLSAADADVLIEQYRVQVEGNLRKLHYYEKIAKAVRQDEKRLGKTGLTVGQVFGPKGLALKKLRDEIWGEDVE